MRSFAVGLATMGGVGARLPAPGTTVGSLVAVVLYLALYLLGGGASALGPAELAAWAWAAFTVAITVAGVWAAGEGEKAHGRDANAIVVDETAGMAIALLFLPFGWQPLLAAFFFFRLFDIVKPFPANRAQNLRGGWGVMADDVVAGVYANLATRGALEVMAALR